MRDDLGNVQSELVFNCCWIPQIMREKQDMNLCNLCSTRDNSGNFTLCCNFIPTIPKFHGSCTTYLLLKVYGDTEP